MRLARLSPRGVEGAVDLRHLGELADEGKEICRLSLLEKDFDDVRFLCGR